jgi:hypothetical protein
MTDDAPAWAKGYPLDFLRAVAALFKAELGPHSYGAFGVPKENTIAEAHAEGGLIWTRDKFLRDSPIVAAAIVRQLAAPSTHEDFAGRKAKLQAGDLFIRSLAGSLEGKGRILARLLERSAERGRAVWVEGHVENRELVALLEGLKFRRVMTKIAGSSDLKGLWIAFAKTPNWHEPSIRSRMPGELHAADEPALAILAGGFISEEERDAILAEAEAYSQLVGGAWADHYSGYNKRHSWTAFALLGFDPADPSFIEKPAEMNRAWKKANPERRDAKCGPTSALAHFPAAMAVAARIPGAKQRLRLMRLAPQGGELTRHADITDPEAGTGPGKLARLHIPLRTSEACSFRGWGLDGEELERHFPERALCYLDTRKPHAARNEGEVERIHLVLDCFVGPELRRMIAAEARLQLQA